MKTSSDVFRWSMLALVGVLWAGPALADQECSEELRLRAKTVVYATPPVYNTRDGWLLGERRDSLPAGAVVRVCERRTVGLLFSRRTWLRVSYAGQSETRTGWLYAGEAATSAREGAAGQARMLLGLLLPRPALAQEPDGLPSPTPNPAEMFLQYVCVLLGMLFKGFHDYFKAGMPKRWKRYLAETLSAVVVSPIVFSGIIHIGAFDTAGGPSGLITLLFIAFETGFFWQAVLARRGAESPAVVG